MTHGRSIGLTLAFAFTLAGASAMAEPQHDHGGGQPEAGYAASHEAPHGEAHPGPSGYQRVTEPQGWDKRPEHPAAPADRTTYQHNYQAARTFKVGAYRRPSGFVARHWGYGQRLPRGYWASQYILADYWLFALEVPPTGYEWVRVDGDALLIDTSTGEILQTEYGVFG